MKPKVQDTHGRFTKSEVKEILSLANRSECREKLKRAVMTSDLIEHWLDKHLKPCLTIRKEVELVCGVDAVGAM